jgi:predicted DNA-binding protein with PD1-like motif
VEGIDTIGSQKIERVVQFRIAPGADLLAAIEDAVRAQKIRAGVIVSGLGALQKAIFRNLKRFPKQYPVTPEDRIYLEMERPMELVSLTGWVATKPDGEAEIHAHFSASTVEDEQVITLGGHLTHGTLCGIKAVVAILVVADEGVHADRDQSSKTYDVFFS